MANLQKMEVEIELKCNAQKFWESIKDFSYLKAGNDDIESVELLEGDGKSPGSIFEFKRKPGSRHIFRVIKEKIEYLDEEKKTLSYSAIGEELLNYFKSYKGSVVVISKGEGALIKWTVEFIKTSDLVSEDTIRDRIVKLARDIEQYVLKA